MSTTISGGDITTDNVTIKKSGTAPTLQNSDNSTNIATTAFVKNNLSSEQIPSGIIVMWSGSSSNIPAGWLLCDGNSNTPNLQGRFIIGSSSSYTIGQTGGTSTVSLTVEEIPAHNHQMQTAGSHNHDSIVFNPGEAGYGFATQSFYDGPNSMNFAGDHTHNIENTGGGGQHENMPPYYVLAYIMKS